MSTRFQRRRTEFALAWIVAVNAAVAFPSHTFGQSPAPSSVVDASDAALEADTVDELVARLKRDDFHERQAAARALSERGVEAVAPLVQAAVHEGAECRARAIWALERHALSPNRAIELAVATEVERVASERDSSGNPLPLAIALKARVDRARREDAIARLRALDARVELHDERPDGAVARISFSESWKGRQRDVALIERFEDLLYLDLESSAIGDRAMASVAKLKRLERLDLSRSRVRMGLDQLAGADKLEVLILGELPLGEAELAKLPPLPSLRFLWAPHTRVDDAALAHLAQQPRLVALSLDGAAVTHEGLRHLAPLGQLETLSLAGTNISGAGLTELKRLSSLKKLSLKDCVLTPDDVTQVAAIETLLDLGLDHTNAGDEHVARLVGCKRLTTLWLSKTKITDAALEDVAKIRSLTKVYLHGTEASPSAIADLKQALPNCDVQSKTNSEDR